MITSRCASRRDSLAARPAGRQPETSRRNLQRLFYYHSAGESITTHDGNRFVTVGVLYPDGVFRKSLKPEHILRIPPAISLQADVVEELEQCNCIRIEADVYGMGLLVVSFSTFLRESFTLERGYGLQLALPICKWHRAESMTGDLFGGEI